MKNVFEKTNLPETLSAEMEEIFPLISTKQKREIISQTLNELGITQLSRNAQLGNSLAQWENNTDLTLVFLPQDSQHVNCDSAPTTKNMLRENGLTAKTIYESVDINYPTGMEVKKSGWVHYLSDRNVLISLANPFADDKILSKTLSHIKSLNPKFLTSMERYRKQMVEQLTQAHKQRVSYAKSEVTNLDNDEKSLVRQHKDTFRLLIEKQELVKLLETQSQNLGEQLDKDIETIKKMPFVKKLEITKTGLDIGFGHICIIGKVKTGTVKDGMINKPVMETKKVNIGELTFHLGSRIGISSNTPLADGSTHPHSLGKTTLCFGDQATNVTKMLEQMELVKLTQFLFAWSVSYNEKGNPFRMLQEFFDKNGASK